jgi:uncharacterized Zn finger protein
MDKRTAYTLSKAARLVQAGRCHVIAAERDRFWIGVVEGDSARYLVTVVRRDAMPRLTGSVPADSSCTCKAAREGRGCSHMLAASTMLRNLTPVDELFDRVAGR